MDIEIIDNSTHGQRAQPYLKPAVADHAQQYHSIIEEVLRRG